MRACAGERWLIGVLTVALLAGCDQIVGRTFEPGVEHVPGPANFLIRIVPPEAVDRVAFAGYGDRVVLFAARRGDERYLLGSDLPSTLRARVDGRDCVGSIVMVTDIEYDGTLTISADGCELRLDLAHGVGALDHALVDDGPVAS